MDIRQPVSRIQPYHPLAVSIAAITFCWVLFFAVDAFNVAGLRDRLAFVDMHYKATWFYIFAEAGPIEWAQWLFLGIAIICGGVTAGRFHESPDARRRGASQFWFILSVGLMLMLLEDTGSVRHQLRDWLTKGSGNASFGAAGEYLMLTILAGVPLYAALRHGRAVWSFPRSRWFVLGAFGAYGIEGLIEFTGDFWYVGAGGRINNALGGQLVRVDEWHWPTEYWLMDYMVEESLELLAASLMCAASLAFLRECVRDSPATPGLASMTRP